MSVYRVQLTVPLFLFHCVFFFLYKLLFGGVKLLRSQVFYAHFVSFSDKFHLLFWLCLLLFHIFKILLLFLNKTLRFLLHFPLIKIDKQRCDLLIHVKLLKERSLFQIIHSNIAIHARRDQLTLPNCNSRDTGGNSFELPNHLAIFPCIQLKYLSHIIACIQINLICIV